MSNITSLTGAAVPGVREPDPEIVALAEELLEKAKDGRLHGLAFVTVIDDHVGTGWAGAACRHLMLAGATRLQWRMAEDYENAET